MRRLALAPALMAGGAAAADCPITYPEFERTVPHIDLEACPADLAADDRFCRAVTGEDALHVFVFTYEGEQCLAALETYETGRFRVVFD